MGMKSNSRQDIIRPAYVQVTVVAITHLELLDRGQVEPYVHLSLGAASYETAVLLPDEDLQLTFELDISEDPLVIRVIDRDHYFKGETLLSVVLPEYEFPEYRDPIDLYIRFPCESEDAMPILSPTLLLSGTEAAISPCLHVRIAVWDEAALSRIRVNFTETSIRTSVTETYTLYHVQVCRADGANWIVQLRYSALCQIRAAMMRDYPEIRTVSFPSKTYAECLTALCPAFSRFSSTRIEDRSKTLEAFTNAALQACSQNYPPLLRLLHIH